MTRAPGLLCGVTGWPLDQSLSPLLHNQAFADLGIAGRYEAWPRRPDELEDFVRFVRERPVQGVSVTIPHKERILPLLDGLTREARSLGAVNTLFWSQGKLLGHNTDLEGFMLPVRDRPAPVLALLLGTGGAARAAAAGLGMLGAGGVVLAGRSPDKGAALAGAFACRSVPWEKRGDVLPDQGPFWVVNATPLGMKGKAEEETPCGAEFLAAAAARAKGGCLAYDLVYNPLRTRFLREAAAGGWAVQDGLAMLVAQAAAQFRIWTGRSFSLDRARAAALGVLKNA
jgi:shikimate dehydrogenase